MNIKNELRKPNEPPDIEFFKLEYNIFNSIYKVCPSNYNDFKLRFKKEFVLSYITNNNELIGFSFLDIIIPGYFYYLRVIAISENHRNKGYATSILDNLINYINKNEFILAFVSDNPRITSIISKFHSLLLSKAEISDVSKFLFQYNVKLLNQTPNSWVKKYYELVDNSYSDAFFYLKKL